MLKTKLARINDIPNIIGLLNRSEFCREFTTHYTAQSIREILITSIEQYDVLIAYDTQLQNIQGLLVVKIRNESNVFILYLVAKESNIIKRMLTNLVKHLVGDKREEHLQSIVVTEIPRKADTALKEINTTLSAILKIERRENHEFNYSVYSIR